MQLHMFSISPFVATSQGQWIDCTASFKDGRFVGPQQEEGAASVADSRRKPSPTRKIIWTKECQPRISAPKGQLRITTRPRPKTALTTVTAKRQRQRPISMKAPALRCSLLYIRMHNRVCLAACPMPVRAAEACCGPAGAGGKDRRARVAAACIPGCTPHCC